MMQKCSRSFFGAYRHGSPGEPPVTTDGEKMYGSGVTDCKGGAVASLMAMEALTKCGFHKRPVKLILQTDEETSSKESNKKTVEFMLKKSKEEFAFLSSLSQAAKRLAIVAYNL